MWISFNSNRFARGDALGAAAVFGDKPLPTALAPDRPAVFIDKDGTLVEDAGESVDPARLRFLPGAGEALAGLSQAGFALVVVTNQSGIARGNFSRAEFVTLQSALSRRLRDEFGVVLTDLMLCPHAPGRDGAPACLCRKPAPGLLIRAARAHRLDLAQSWMVGDMLDDVEAGHRAGCRSVLLDSGGETLWRRSPLREPDAQFSQWPELAEMLIAARAACANSVGPADPSADARPS